MSARSLPTEEPMGWKACHTDHPRESRPRSKKSIRKVFGPHDPSSFVAPGAMRQITGIRVSCLHLAIRQIVGRFPRPNLFVAGLPATPDSPIWVTEGSRRPAGVPKSDEFATDVAGAAHAATTTMTTTDLRNGAITIPIFSLFDD